MTIAEHLADFGDTKKQRSRRRKSKHDAAQCKSIAPYQHVVVHRPARPEEKQPAYNRPSEPWSPRFPEQKPFRQLGDRVEPAKALMGFDPERVQHEGYAWTAGE